MLFRSHYIIRNIFSTRVNLLLSLQCFTSSGRLKSLIMNRHHAPLLALRPVSSAQSEKIYVRWLMVIMRLSFLYYSPEYLAILLDGSVFGRFGSAVWGDVLCVYLCG